MGLAVFPIVEVIFNRLRAEFPMQIKPPFGFTDFIGEHATAGFPRVGTDGDIYSGNDSANTDNAQGGVEFDPIARCLTARSLFVLHDNVIDGDGYGVGDAPDPIGEYGNPTVAWSDIVYSTPDYQAESLNDIPGYTSVRVSLFDPSPEVGIGNFTMIGTPGTEGVGCQGFTARLQYYTLSTPVMADWEEGYEPYKASFAIRFRVTGSGRGKIRWYSVAFVMASGIRIGYNDEVDAGGNPDEDFWSYIDEGKAGDAKANNIFPSLESFETGEVLTDSGVQLFEVRLIGGQLRIMFGSEDTPYVWPHPQEDDTATPDWLIDRWMAAGEELFLARWSVHLTKWYTTAATISNEINCGFAPSAVQLLVSRSIFLSLSASLMASLCSSLFAIRSVYLSAYLPKRPGSRSSPSWTMALHPVMPSRPTTKDVAIAQKKLQSGIRLMTPGAINPAESAPPSAERSALILDMGEMRTRTNAPAVPARRIHIHICFCSAESIVVCLSCKGETDKNVKPSPLPMNKYAKTPL